MLPLKPWRTEAVLLFIGAQVCCFFIGATIAAVLQKIGVPGFKTENDFLFIVFCTFGFQGVTFILMGLFFRLHEVDWIAALGVRNRLLPALLLASGVVIYILPVAQQLQQISIAIMIKCHWAPQDEAAVKLITDAVSPITQIYLVLFTIVLAPVGEEFIFRGMLFPFIKQRGWPKTAWLGVSFLFALIHGDMSILIPLFVLALALTWLYETTDNLLAPIFAHGLFNAANLMILKYLQHQ
jgi:membrane protease YdiL (CAAX protease family)